MAAVASEETGVGRSVEGISSGQRCQAGEALAEWRSFDQVENGTPSTSPPYWDSDDDDGGPRPSELYGKYTWKIEKFSQINKRELRSNAFEVGGYKWYILIYPQGCDVCNHLSLFLCVANHDKLLPGWSHFAQFTIAVVNKDPKKSKYSDTLHRFWKKEHDWGWKKFMELSKVYDGFIESDTLIIKAQVQVIREKAEVILKIVVKHFFIEKEVTSTLVMDSLYSGLKALEGQSKGKKAKSKLLDAEEMPAPIVHMEKDMFLLVDDVLLLLKRAALEPLPPKDEKGPQNRTKDGNSGEDFNKDSIERDERRLTELGRRTVEIFVLSHIFSNKIEVAYQEAVALKRQEELIREEAAWLAESEQKAKRGASEKEKKSKKKQAKQKRNNRKNKEKGREDKAIVAAERKHQEYHPDDEKEASVMVEEQPVPEKADVLGDVSDSVDAATEVLQPDSEDRDASPVNWDTDTSEIHPPTEACTSGISGLSCVQNGVADKRSPSLMDDSSSTCSTDSVPSVVMNGPYKGNSFSNNHNKKSLSRGRNQRSKTLSDGSSWTTESDYQPPCPALDAGHQNDVTESSKAGEAEFEAAVSSSDQTKWAEQDAVRKEEVVLPLKKPSTKDSVDLERPKEKTAAGPSSPRSPSKNLLPAQLRSEEMSAGSVDSISVRKTLSNGLQQSDQPASSSTSVQITGILKSETQKSATPKPSEPTIPQVPVMSRPSSAPLIPGTRPTTPVVSMVQTTPLLARSVSAVGHLGPDLSPAAGYVPQSYRNAIMGNHNVASSSAGFTHSNSPSSGINPSLVYSQPPALVSAPLYMPQSSGKMEPNSVQSGLPFGLVTRETFRSAPHWMENSQRDSSRSMHSNTLLGEFENLDLYRSVQNGSREHFSMEFPACASGRQTQGVLADEFPHLDIINELLDEEHNVGKAARAGAGFHALGNEPYLLNQHFPFHSDLGLSDGMGSSSGSCRFERMRSYHNDGFQQGYSSSSSNHFDTEREFIPQASPLHYANGQQIDGLVPNRWQMAASDLSLLSMRNADGENYAYYSPEYPNMACGINGYTVFRPSNGH
ncbi:TNF receptor-associated factor homolog 1b isoform X2 [Gossypium raimondii]|uniref:TNF receptor-associated factor homolog 1b isoform X2 n=1 Tax=Gossypium raimondii TaxID=29730 RepID=UPI00227AC09C|nr:TNF receptor-associated factor homolog 1b isoform X2 [Gossypium raimondii]